MLYKVTRKQLKVAYTLLNNRKKETQSISSLNKYDAWIEEIGFAIYKTKLNIFLIDYELAKEIRPALLLKEGIKNENK